MARSEDTDDGDLLPSVTPMPKRISKYHDHSKPSTQCHNALIARCSGCCRGGPADGMISSVVAACMVINWVVGAGALGLPYVMQKAGVGVAVILLLATTATLYVTANMLADAFARADALERLELLASEAGVSVTRRSTVWACCFRDAAVSGAERSPLVGGVDLGGTAAAEVGSSSSSSLSAIGGRHESSEAVAIDHEAGRTSRAASSGGISLADMSGARSPSASSTASASSPHSGLDTHIEVARKGSDYGTLAADAAADSSSPGTLTHKDLLRHAKWLRDPVFLMSHRKIEIVELVKRLAGTIASRIYLVFVGAYLYGAMWSYAAVFGQSFVSRFPLPIGDTEEQSEQLSFFVYEAVFGVVAIGLALFDVREQVSVQLVMTGVRALVFGSMLVTGAIALGAAGSSDPRGGFVTPGFDGYSASSVSVSSFMFGSSGSVSLSSIALVIPVVVYAQLFHTGIAVLVEPMRRKQDVSHVIGAAYGATTTVYLVVGGVLAVLFGSATASSVQVNWARFGEASGSNLAVILGYMIVLFPGIDTLSVTPLSTVALSSNMISAVYGERAPKAERNVWIVRGFRLLAGVPPVIAACINHDLGTTLDAAGLVGLFICIILPPMAWILTKREFERLWCAAPGEHAPALALQIAQRLEAKAATISTAAPSAVLEGGSVESDLDDTLDDDGPVLGSGQLLQQRGVWTTQPSAISPYSPTCCAREGCAWGLSLLGCCITLLVVLSMVGVFGLTDENEADSASA